MVLGQGGSAAFGVGLGLGVLGLGGAVAAVGGLMGGGAGLLGTSGPGSTVSAWQGPPPPSDVSIASVPVDPALPVNVPEPSGMATLFLGLFVLALLWRRRQSFR